MIACPKCMQIILSTEDLGKQHYLSLIANYFCIFPLVMKKKYFKTERTT